MALRDVVQAQAAVSELSKRTGIDAETLLDALSNEDAPRLDMLSTILNALECQLPVEPRADVNEAYPRTSTNQWQPVRQLKDLGTFLGFQFVFCQNGMIILTHDNFYDKDLKINGTTMVRTAMSMLTPAKIKVIRHCRRDSNRLILS